MATSKNFLASTLVFFLATLLPDVAEGYAVFLSSSNGHFWSDNHNAFDQANPHGTKGSSKHNDKDYERQIDVDHVEQPASHKYPVIFAAHLQLEKVFGRSYDSWYKDWKIWVGLFLWSIVWVKRYYHGYRNMELYHVKAAFAFGLNMIILHVLQYASTIGTGLMIVSVLLCVQSLTQNTLWFYSDKHEDKDEFLCDTLYLDISLPPEQVMVLFISQICVWWFYMTSILGNFRFTHVNYLFWLIAFMAMQMTMIFNRGEDSVLGAAFPIHDVNHLLQKVDKVQFREKDDKGELVDADAEPFTINKFDLISRAFMGFICNAILREIMAFTIPLMLMGFEEPMDFVVYCVGVNFICTLDDMSKRTFDMSDRKDEESVTASS